MNAQKIKLNLVPGGIPPVVHVSQYDEGRPLQFDLYDGMSPATIVSGTQIDIRATKPDGHGFAYNCTYSGNTVSINTQLQMTAVSGEFACELRLRREIENVGTANFILEVEPAALRDDTDISGSELGIFIDLGRANAEAAANSATAAANSATAAANSATAAANRAANAEINANAALVSAERAKSWATYSNDLNQYGNDTNNAHYWSDRAHLQFNQLIASNEVFVDQINATITDALNRINAIQAIIELMYGSIYISTEAGDMLITEAGDRLIINY